MRTARISFGMVIVFFFSILINNIAVARNPLEFVYPLPNVPQEMTAGEGETITYSVSTAIGATVYNIISNYDEPSGDIVNLGTCKELPLNSSCEFKIKIAPKRLGNLSLQLRLIANNFSVFITEPRISTIKVIPVRIKIDPISDIVKTGGSTRFFVDAVGGPTPLKYQWRLNGENIFGATSTMYSVKNASKEYDAGKYTVVVSTADGSGSVTSKEATLQVGDGPVINTNPISQIIATDKPVTFSVDATGLGELKYQWMKGGVEISGATSKNYNIPKTAKSDAGDYQVKVTDGTLVTVTSNLATLQVGDGPVINTQPVGKIIATNNPVTFSVTATGLGELKYQWMKGGVEISGATSKNYNIPKTAKSDAGDYQVKVTDGTLVTVTSNLATLQVGDGPVINTNPISQIIATDKPVTFSVDATGLGELKYQWMKGGVEISGATSKNYNIPKTAKSDAGDYQVKVTDGTLVTVTSNLATLQVGDGPVINTQPVGKIIATNNPVTFSVTATGLGELKYQWMKGGVEISGATSKNYNIPKTAKSDAGDYQVKVTDGTLVTVTSNLATLQVGDGPVINTNPISQIIATNNSVTFSVTASGLGELKYQWIKNGAEISGAINKDYTISKTAKTDAGNYQVKVTDGTLITVTSNPATLQVGDAPTIITQPASQTMATGKPVIFKVVAGGTGQFTYQWKKDGVDISGATSDTYNISTVQFIHAGKYSVLVTSDYGNVLSNDAILRVGDAPSEAAIQPASQTVAVGQSITFKVTSKGTPPFTYQWKKNDADISGATSDTYIATAQAGGKVKYTVKVSSDYGNAISNEAILNSLTITSITPGIGPAGGVTQVTINGYGFDGSDSSGKNTYVLFKGVEYIPSPITSTTAAFTVPQDLTIVNTKQDQLVKIKVDNVMVSSPTPFTYYDPFLRSISDDPKVKNLPVVSMSYDDTNQILYVATDNSVYSYSLSAGTLTTLGSFEAGRFVSGVLFVRGTKALYVCINSVSGGDVGIYKYDFGQKGWNKIAGISENIDVLVENEKTAYAASFMKNHIFTITNDVVTKTDTLSDTITALASPSAINWAATLGGKIYYQYANIPWSDAGTLPGGSNAHAIYTDSAGQYVGSDTGVFFEPPDYPPSKTWVNVEGEIKQYQVYVLNSDIREASTCRVYAGTQGNGLWYSSGKDKPTFFRVPGMNDQEANTLNIKAIETSSYKTHETYVGTFGYGGLHRLYHNYISQ